MRALERKSFSSRVESWNQSWMWSSSFPEGADARRVESDPRGDQVRVIAELARLRDEDLQVVAQQGFATGEPKLDRTQRARFPQHAQPVAGGEFRALGRVVDRVGAEHAVQRTAVRELCQSQRGPAGRAPLSRPGDPAAFTRPPRGS